MFVIPSTAAARSRSLSRLVAATTATAKLRLRLGLAPALAPSLVGRRSIATTTTTTTTSTSTSTSTRGSGSKPLSPYKTHTPQGAGEPLVHTFFDGPSATWTYVVVGVDGRTCVLIDPVLDYDAARNAVSTVSADGMLAFLAGRGYSVARILETHAHADHLTAAAYLRERLPHHPPVCIGAGITAVRARCGITAPATHDFDLLFPTPPDGDGDGEATFEFGGSTCSVLHLPGHTPDHVGYLIGHNIFAGDLVFQPDVGSARADFPGASPHALYASLQRILQLPDHTRIYIGHDYPPPHHRPPSCFTTVAQTRDQNIHLVHGKDAFLTLRNTRDASLPPPKLLHPSLQVNIRAGKLPDPDPDGTRYFRIPIQLSDSLK